MKDLIRYFPKRHFPKGDFPSDNFPCGNFPNVQFTERQLSHGWVRPSDVPQSAMGDQALRLE